jgi:ABC-type nitrate/sulfonate/bicarbonate transport system permease component
VNSDRRFVRALLRVGRTLGVSLFSLAVICGIWQGAITLLHLSPFVAKGPVDVYRFLVSGSSAGANRTQLLAALGVTVRDAALGYLAGTAVAIAVSLAVALRRAIGLVTFFPTLVNVTQGLKAAPAAAFDLFTAYGASDMTILRKARLPYALPAIFASARIAAPGALLGAILAEWLSSGQGLGNLMVTSSSTANYSMLWACVVAITAVSIFIYNAVSAVERPVVARLGVQAT